LRDFTQAITVKSRFCISLVFSNLPLQPLTELMLISADGFLHRAKSVPITVLPLGMGESTLQKTHGLSVFVQGSSHHFKVVKHESPTRITRVVSTMHSVT